jgi:hypothetical protein
MASALPLKKQDFGMSRWQLAVKSASAHTRYHAKQSSERAAARTT